MSAPVSPDSKPISLIQLTDCHLGKQVGEKLLGLDTDESLLDVLHKLQQGEAPDLVLATGDISCHGDITSYHRFLSYMKRYFDHPLAWLPGNHDLTATMNSVQADQESIQSGVVVFERWQLVLLDSSVLGQEWGNLAEDQLSHLQQCLESSDKHTLVFVHHQPVPVGSKWIDQYIIRNADALWALLDRHPQVKGLIWGHVHQEFESQRQGLKLLATPSTCIQFEPDSEDFAVDAQMPGYRWFQLYADGRFDTGVERVRKKDYGVDLASGGY